MTSTNFIPETCRKLVFTFTQTTHYCCELTYEDFVAQHLSSDTTEETYRKVWIEMCRRSSEGAYEDDDENDDDDYEPVEEMIEEAVEEAKKEVDLKDVDDRDCANTFPYKKCSVCGERKSCGNYDDDYNWFCEDCYVEETENKMTSNDTMPQVVTCDLDDC